MSGSGTWALVPLRQLAGGKERLAGVLPAAARCALVEAMAEDLVRALLELPLPSTQIVLVSEDPEVAGFALRLGVALFRPSPAVCDPLNAALAEAASRAAGSGAEAVLMIHADLPRASGPALRRLLAAHAASPSIPHATLVSDREGTGTNCLLLSPPLAIPLLFGPGSRARHVQACAEAGLPCRELTEPALAFDIDVPADLALLVHPGETQDNAPGERSQAWIHSYRRQAG
jgi:2-phospho-L-lactate guanylyltransferase